MRIARQQLQVGYSIIQSISIQVMHQFKIFLEFAFQKSRLQKTTQFFFHFQPMFSNISTTISKWMTGLFNKFITLNNFESLKIPGNSTTRSVSFFKSSAFLSSSGFRLFSSYQSFMLTFRRAISRGLPSIRQNIKDFMATKTLFFHSLNYTLCHL